MVLKKILNKKYGIYSGIEVEQRKKNTDSHYFELFLSFVLS
jgi:hypothetical protein